MLLTARLAVVLFLPLFIAGRDASAQSRCETLPVQPNGVSVGHRLHPDYGACRTRGDRYVQNHPLRGITRSRQVHIQLRSDEPASIALSDQSVVLEESSNDEGGPFADIVTTVEPGTSYTIQVLTVGSRPASGQYSLTVYDADADDYTWSGTCRTTIAKPIRGLNNSYVGGSSDCDLSTGDPGFVRTFTLDSTYDVQMAFIPRGNTGRAFVSFWGTGGTNSDWTMEDSSASPGASAVISLNLGPGTYYVAFAGRDLPMSGTIYQVLTSPSRVPERPRAVHSASCSSAAGRPLLETGKPLAGRILVGSCRFVDGSELRAEYYRLNVQEAGEYTLRVDSRFLTPAIEVAGSGGRIVGRGEAKPGDTTLTVTAQLEPGTHIVRVAQTSVRNSGSYTIGVSRGGRTNSVATTARPPDRSGCTLQESGPRRVVEEPWFLDSRPIVVMGEVFQKFGLPRRFPQDSVVAYDEYRGAKVYQVETRRGMVFVHTGECWFQGYAVDEAGDQLRTMDGAALVRCITGATRSLALGATTAVALSPRECGAVTANMAALTFRPANRGHFAVYVTRISGDATPTLRILDARGRELFETASMDGEKLRGVMSVEAGTYYIVLGGLPSDSGGQLRVVIHPN